MWWHETVSHTATLLQVCRLDVLEASRNLSTVGYLKKPLVILLALNIQTWQKHAEAQGDFGPSWRRSYKNDPRTSVVSAIGFQSFSGAGLKLIFKFYVPESLLNAIKPLKIDVL